MSGPPEKEATRVLRKRRGYVNPELYPWAALAMQLCPQRLIYQSIVDKDQVHGTVLEVGFGTGAQVVTYHHKANWVTATEIDPEAVEWATKMWPLPHTEWIVHDICAGGEFMVKFDTLFCIEVLEHVADPAQGMANIAKNLKVGGLAFISVPRGETTNELHKSSWDAQSFKDDLERCFDNVRVDEHTWNGYLLAECGYA